ncbi:hypothetical protein SAMN05880556_12314 [Azospirillum sp. RU38E]|nr:hypothetical protein SAMN05880556_12314 [Azospirillum sp. RU38E]SNT25011.1 hypothetical protein SAMN05880591_12414 [Azospirillum sp. RU37A]
MNAIRTTKTLKNSKKYAKMGGINIFIVATLA